MPAAEKETLTGHVRAAVGKRGGGICLPCDPLHLNCSSYDSQPGDPLPGIGVQLTVSIQDDQSGNLALLHGKSATLSGAALLVERTMFAIEIYWQESVHKRALVRGNSAEWFASGRGSQLFQRRVKCGWGRTSCFPAKRAGTVAFAAVELRPCKNLPATLENPL